MWVWGISPGIAEDERQRFTKTGRVAIISLIWTDHNGAIQYDRPIFLYRKDLSTGSLVLCGGRSPKDRKKEEWI